MRARLRCQVSLGQFSSEYVVVVQSSAGREFSLFADRDMLSVNRTPTDEETVDGWIVVEILEEKGSVALVKLPQSTLENGPFLTVGLGQLDIRRPVPPQPTPLRS